MLKNKSKSHNLENLNKICRELRSSSSSRTTKKTTTMFESKSHSKKRLLRKVNSKIAVQKTSNERETESKSNKPLSKPKNVGRDEDSRGKASRSTKTTRRRSKRLTSKSSSNFVKLFDPKSNLKYQSAKEINKEKNKLKLEVEKKSKSKSGNDSIRRSSRIKFDRNNGRFMQPIYTVDEIIDFEGKQINVLKICRFEEKKNDLILFTEKFSRDYLDKIYSKNKSDILEKKKKKSKKVDSNADNFLSDEPSSDKGK
jgi:hypothetical protein